MEKRWTMRKALLVLCISSVVFALLLQTFLFHQSLRRQIRVESISDHELSLNKMQTDLSDFIHTIRGEMLTIYSEQDLISAMRDAAEGCQSEGLLLEKLVFCEKTIYEGGSGSGYVSL